MALSDADRKRRQRLREAGYRGAECPVPFADMSEQAKDDTVAWAEGVWRRQGELMPKPRRVPVPK
jgi:hypothetical protein